MDGKTIIIFLLLALIGGLVADRLQLARDITALNKALDDMKAGNLNRRVLIHPGSMAAPLFFKINTVMIQNRNALLATKNQVAQSRQAMTSLAHDVRTPLTTLIGYLDALESGLAEGEEADDYLHTARKKARDLQRYVDTLFEWCKLGSGETTLTIETIDVAEVARQIAADWLPALEGAGIICIFNIPEKPVMAQIDAEALRRIIGNLFQNVLVHSQATQLALKLNKEDGKVMLAVADNGKGIDTVDLPHVFERLYKCDSARSGKGSGLGLAIAKALAEAMEAEISVESRLGEGTRFTLQLST